MSDANPSSDFWRGVWRFSDPKITLASLAAMIVGGSAAWHDGGIHFGWLGITIVGIFLIEAAKNASGDVVDYHSGTDLAVSKEDRSPFSGGKRVLVDGLMSPRQAAWVAAVFYAGGIVAGLSIVWLREPTILWVGLAGVGLAYFYHGAPLRLSYRGLGEVAVAFTYGPLIVVGTYLVQHHNVPSWIWWHSAPLGLLIGAFLWINEFPDFEADRSAGKRTLVVRLGRTRAAHGYAALIGVAYLLNVVLAVLHVTPMAAMGGLLGLPLSVRATKRLMEAPKDTAKIVPAQAWTLMAFVAHALGTAAGLML